MAAMRTAKIDYIDFLTPEDASLMRKTGSFKEGTQQRGAIDLLFMRTDKAPFNDIRVRQAMTMAIDFQTMNQSLYRGTANVITFPYWHVKGYDDLYMDIDAPDLPANIKELYSYKPDKAKQLLSDAGFSNGLKTEMLLTNRTAHIDYYSIIKEYWSKVGIDVTLKPMEFNALFGIRFARDYDQLCTCFTSPVGTYPEQAQFTGTSITNLSRINDPKLNAEAERARIACLTGDYNEGMKITRAILPYLIEQCYAIPSLRYPLYNFWWPWVKNYSGETIIGNCNDYYSPTYIWVDQALRKTMGY